MSPITLRNVRCSYPELFKPKFFGKKPAQPGQEPKYSCTFILDKKLHAELIADIRATAKAVAEEKWGKGKVPSSVKVCLRDGSEKADTDGYGPEVMFVSSSSTKRPSVVDRLLSPLEADTTKLYAGCYINAFILLWAQDNEYGKRVNAELKAVQLVRDGDPFGKKPVDAAEVFMPMDQDDEAASLMG